MNTGNRSRGSRIGQPRPPPCIFYRGRIEEAIALQQEFEDPEQHGLSMGVLGEIAEAHGDRKTARLHHEEALRTFRAIGQRLGIALQLAHLAGIAATVGEAARAARLFGAAMALREAIGAPIPPVEQPAIDQAVASARNMLGAAAWAQGAAMSMQDAVAYALTRDGDGK